MRNAITCLLLSRWSPALHASNCELLCDLSHAVCHRSFFLFTASGLNPRCLFPTHCPHPPHTPLSGPCSLLLFVLLAYIVSCIHYLSSLHPASVTLCLCSFPPPSLTLSFSLSLLPHGKISFPILPFLSPYKIPYIAEKQYPFHPQY